MTATQGFMKGTMLFVVPFFLGLYISPSVLSENLLKRFLHRTENEILAEPIVSESLRELTTGTGEDNREEETLFERKTDGTNLPKAKSSRHPNVDYLNKVVLSEDNDDPFSNLSFVIHRNGESEPCGSSSNTNSLNDLRRAMINLEYPYNEENESKYLFDTFLTTALSHFILSPDECPSVNNELKKMPSFPSFCDMGQERTTVQPDHHHLIPLSPVAGEDGTNLPCHFHTREGLRITSLAQLAATAKNIKNNMKGGLCDDDGSTTAAGNDKDERTCTAVANEIHLYAVPAGRLFLFAPTYVGETFDLSHVNGPLGLPVSLKVISLSPRVFDVLNFFTPEESSDIVDKAIAETSETFRMKRSSTGASGYNVNARRTSDNGFDTQGKTAMGLKRRSFEVLGIDKYEECFADGLQVLRYNKTNAYIPHLDWIDDPAGRELHDYDSGKLGTNRFATILLYMSDIPEGQGGETVFTQAWSPEESENDHKNLDEALDMVRKLPIGQMLKQKSWEEKMTAQCMTRLSIKPHASRAVLFYSQQPDGTTDHMSLHGACPVLGDVQKWAANLWVWNGPRGGYPGAPRNRKLSQEQKQTKQKEEQINQLQASFLNTGDDPEFANAELYFQDTRWGAMIPGQPLRVNTYTGHRWYVRVDGKVKVEWVIGEAKKQSFSL
mmetsp:Transcript_45591/g.55332  ORF Transcript_45591/g.55332 Transcript_45591/m.55332 type:complete len:666 (+) Transcript_45591:50-2047(+)